MDSRFLLYIFAPMLLISLLLVGLGSLAAWNVRQHQASVSDLVNHEFHNSLEAQRLLLVVSDVRQCLRQYLLKRDDDYLDEIELLHSQVNEHLHNLGEYASSEAAQNKLGNPRSAKEIWTELDQSCHHFFEVLANVRDIESDALQRKAAMELDEILNEQVRLPIRAYVQTNELAADRAHQANLQTATQMTEAFLLLGVCGGLAGLVAGIGIARGLRRQILNLDISVRGTADKLQEVVGPVRVSTTGGLGGLQTGLKEVESQVAVIVERLQQREKESLRSQKLAAIGQLAAGLAHELRNPLMPMKMLVQKALSRPDSPGMTQRQLQVMDEEIRRMEGLVQEILDFARPQPLERKPISLASVIKQALDLVSARASLQDVTLTFHQPDYPIEVNADAMRLRQVLLNLFINSLDAQAEGGEIEVTLKESVSTNQGNSQRWVTIEVMDRGTGIPADLHPRIFEPFVSTKETGTGLGLPISQRIIHDHGGTVDGFNRPEGGASFEIRLPRVSEVSTSPHLLPPAEISS
ncbi:sensor histidine kinase [Planctomicrobium sp. SH527]|uniref:sensor histidine kinase n=1 Tax=Planctomicrobium sp. SH527 TaxID=3448123 RepID=UPI003F5BB785